MALAENLQRVLQKLPHRKGDLNGDSEQMIVNFLDSRKLLKMADLENKNRRTYSGRFVNKGKICFQMLSFYSVSPYHTELDV